jgi:hypothetical protein
MAVRTQKRTDGTFRTVSTMYLGASCIYTYIVAVLTEKMAFHNIEVLETQAPAINLTKHSTWFGTQVSIPEFHITLSKVDFCYSFLFFTAILVAAGITGVLAWMFWSNHARLLVIPAAIFVSSIGAVSYLNPAKMGTVLAAVCYSFIFFFARGMREFNVHWELTYNNRPMAEPKFTAIVKLLNQYILTAIAAIAFIVAACFFNAGTLFKDALWSQGVVETNRFYRALQIPFLLSTICYGIWGCFWLSALVIRELHIKQHELLLMPIENGETSEASSNEHGGKVRCSPEP